MEDGSSSKQKPNGFHWPAGRYYRRGGFRLHAVVGHTMTPIDVVDGIDPDDIEVVERWADDEMTFIRTLDDYCQKIFVERSGFIHLADNK